MAQSSFAYFRGSAMIILRARRSMKEPQERRTQEGERQIERDISA
jgi:hypothetical protein